MEFPLVGTDHRIRIVSPAQLRIESMVAVFASHTGNRFQKSVRCGGSTFLQSGTFRIGCWDVDEWWNALPGTGLSMGRKCRDSFRSPGDWFGLRLSATSSEMVGWRFSVLLPIPGSFAGMDHEASLADRGCVSGFDHFARVFSLHLLHVDRSKDDAAKTGGSGAVCCLRRCRGSGSSFPAELFDALPCSLSGSRNDLSVFLGERDELPHAVEKAGDSKSVGDTDRRFVATR